MRRRRRPEIEIKGDDFSWTIVTTNNSRDGEGNKVKGTKQRRKRKWTAQREKQLPHLAPLCINFLRLGLLEVNLIGIAVCLVKNTRGSLSIFAVRWTEGCVMTNGLVKYNTPSILSCLKNSRTASLVLAHHKWERLEHERQMRLKSKIKHCREK